MCHHCGQTLPIIDHMLLECAVLRESRDEYYTADSLNTLFQTISETCIVEFLREAGFFYLIWMVRHSIQSLTWTIRKLKQFFNFVYTISDMNSVRFVPRPIGLRPATLMSGLQLQKHVGPVGRQFLYLLCWAEWSTTGNGYWRSKDFI